jgi:DNA-binding GntR family transcriptional regulator
LEVAVDAMKSALERLEGTTSAPIIDETSSDEDATAIERSESVMDYRHADSLFHIPLVKASGNPFLFKYVEEVRTEFFMPLDVLYRLGGTRQEAPAEHEAILSAVRDQNKDKAAEKMREHIESTRSTLIWLLGERNTAAPYADLADVHPANPRGSMEGGPDPTDTTGGLRILAAVVLRVLPPLIPVVARMK